MSGLGRGIAVDTQHRPHMQHFLARPSLVVLGSLTYAGLLHYSYATTIAQSFSYAGYRYRTPQWDVYFLSILLTVAIALVLPRRIFQPSDFMLWVLYVVAVAPSILIPQYADVLDAGEALLTAAAVTGCFLIAVLGKHGRIMWLVPTPRLSITSFWLLIILISAAVYSYLVATIGVHFRLLALADVYDVRDDYKDQLAGASLVAYVVPFQANVVNPIVVARGLYNRRWSLISIGLIGQLLVYSATGFKTVLFSVPLLLAIMWMFRRSSCPSAPILLAAAVMTSLLALGLDRLFDTVVWTSLFIRRFLVAPGLLTAVYVSLFTDMPRAHLGHSILGGFVDYPYQRSPAYVVGETYFHSADTSANANLFADGFMNFGYLGMAGAAIVLTLTLRLIDGASVGIPTGVAALILVMPTISLANSGILTTLTTHGLLAAIFFLAVLPRSGWGDSDNASMERGMGTAVKPTSRGHG